MTKEFFLECLNSHKNANYMENTKVPYYIRTFEHGFALHQIHGVEGEKCWNEVLEKFDQGEVFINEMHFYAPETINSWTPIVEHSWHEMQPYEFEDENYIFSNTPVIGMNGEFVKLPEK